MKYTWKKRPNDGYGCHNLYMGNVKVGAYVHTLERNTPGKTYSMRFSLPTLETIYNDDPEVLMQKAEVICTKWLEELNKE